MNTIDCANMWNLGTTKTGGKVYWSDSTSSNTTFVPTLKYTPPEDLFYKGERFKVDRIDTAGDSIHGDIELTVKAHKVKCYPTGSTGCAGLSGTVTIDDPGKFRFAFFGRSKFDIKKIVCNPEKNATTVIFKDGSVEVVKKSPEDPEADIYSVVAYAIAKHVYGSNSAFKREVGEHLYFMDRGLDKMFGRTPAEILERSFEALGKRVKKERGGKNANTNSSSNV